MIMRFIMRAFLGLKLSNGPDLCLYNWCIILDWTAGHAQMLWA